MTPNSTTPAEAPAIERTIQKAPDGPRFPSTNIRLSAALCALGFSLRDDVQPVSVVINVEAQSPAITFWHRYEPEPDSALANATYEEHGEHKPLKIVAIDVLAWWNYPGKYSIPGFDDAISAIRRVLEHREWLLALIFGSRRITNQRFDRNSVVTDSLHTASILKACGFELLALEKVGTRSCRFVFPAKAVGIVEQVERYCSPRRDDGRDSCADWMLSGLRFFDLLARRVKESAKMPMIEMRDGERVAQFSSQMPRTMKREFLRHF
ncbi:MAG TPA: hypothetical protein VJS88_00400 [Chthoniobacterales bacterium]|nr:hypothetical protein [Chthoniobacterales bacterium]